MSTLINVVIIGGLFALAYFTARLLSETFGVPYVDPADDPNWLPDPDYFTPTKSEWEEFQRLLDEGGLDEEDHR